MNYLKTEAIILNTVEVFDSDRSFLLFTRESGKIWARAKGVRKPTSKLTGHLLSYLPTKLELVGSESRYIITGAQIDDSYKQGGYPENSLLFQQQAAIVAEVVNRLFTEQDAHTDIYDGLAYTLARLQALSGNLETTTAAQLVTVEFIIKSLAELGYKPQLHVCVVTGEVIQKDSIAWSSLKGGVLSKKGFDETGQGLRVNDSRTIVVIRQFLTPQFWAERIAMPDDVQKEVLTILYDYVQTQIGQPLRSLFGSF